MSIKVRWKYYSGMFEMWKYIVDIISLQKKILYEVKIVSMCIIILIVS